MRNLQLLVILTIVLIAVSLIQREGLFNKQIQKRNIMIPTPTPASNAADATPTPTPSQAPTSIPLTSTPVPSSQMNMSSFVYPGSTILNQSEKEMTLQSFDDPSNITNWYKEKITSVGMNAKSFVTTNTNGNVLNKLAGAKSGFKISLEISKKDNQEKTEISVNLA